VQFEPEEVALVADEMRKFVQTLVGRVEAELAI
jgi:hypothetical protein